jgi:hypothetical protein
MEKYPFSLLMSEMVKVGHSQTKRCDMKGLMLSFVAVSALVSSFGFAEDVKPKLKKIECVASATSAQDVIFNYTLKGQGKIGTDGYLELEEGFRVFVDMNKPLSKRPILLINGVEPNHLDSGLGHAYYEIPGSVYGLTMDLGHGSHSIGMIHRISATETIYSTGGECREI